jgi:hypothetical protein
MRLPARVAGGRVAGSRLAVTVVAQAAARPEPPRAPRRGVRVLHVARTDQSSSFDSMQPHDGDPPEWAMWDNEWLFDEALSSHELDSHEEGPSCELQGFGEAVGGASARSSLPAAAWTGGRRWMRSG